MKVRSSLTFVVIALITMVYGCNVEKQMTGVRAVQQAPADIISDGAHGGNHDFFFLPPLVPLPLNNPDFEIGKFDNGLQPVLTVEICELSIAGTALPAADTPCNVTSTHPLTKKFAAGTVQVVNLPQKQNGWWTLLGLPPDGFYYVLWDTRQSNLVLTKYYRIKVFVNGSTDPIGFADVDPMANLREWKYSLTGQVIQMVDDVLLPIPFRIEKGAFCSGGLLCKSVVVPNDNPNGTSTIVQLQGPVGSVAGAEFPDNWLPPGAPANVIVTVSSVAPGAARDDGTRTIPCHANVPLEQFDGCFKFTTTPALPLIDGAEFAKDVRVAVCYVLHDTSDPRRDWAEIWSSGPNETPHALRGAPDATILTNHDCANPDAVITMSDNPIARLAQTGWRSLKSALTVKTAYAIDVGLGGLTKAFSNIGPAITARLQAEGSTDIGNQPGGTRYILNVLLLGSKVHHDNPAPVGIGGLPVTFSVASDLTNGTLEQHLTGVGSVTPTSIESITMTGAEVDGEASVIWHLPATPGTYHLTATAPAIGSPVTFTATVPAATADLTVSDMTFAPTIPAAGGFLRLSPFTITNLGSAFTLTGLIANGFYLSPDAEITSSDLLVGENNDAEEVEGADAVFVWNPDGTGGVEIPVHAEGIFYFGYLVDRTNRVPELNEANNYVSHALTFVGPDETLVPWAQSDRRMLSMETGATYQTHVTTSASIAWSSNDLSKIVVSSGGLITAVVGGEDIRGGGETSIQTAMSDDSNGPSVLVNGFSFDVFPRLTTLAWKPVSGAITYEVVTEYGNDLRDPIGNQCRFPADCNQWSEVDPSIGGHSFTTALTHTVSFVGGQPGRWHVIAHDANGNVLHTSEWVYFAYIG